MFRLGLILDLHMLKTYNLKDSDKSQRSRKESYIKGNGAFTFDFHLVCHIELYCCCFYFLTMSAKNTLSEKGRPLRSLRHTRRALVLLFVLVHFLWHVFKNVHFFISIFNAQGKEKKIENENENVKMDKLDYLKFICR